MCLVCELQLLWISCRGLMPSWPQSQHVVSKYSVLGGHGNVGDDKELDQFMVLVMNLGHNRRLLHTQSRYRYTNHGTMIVGGHYLNS
ncbi:hypothetical protein Hanom_Chr00s137476g01817811 [Helianthus anomalus]